MKIILAATSTSQGYQTERTIQGMQFTATNVYILCQYTHLSMVMPMEGNRKASPSVCLLQAINSQLLGNNEFIEDFAICVQRWQHQIIIGCEMVPFPNGSKELVNLKHGWSFLWSGECAGTRDFQKLHQLTIIVLPYQRLINSILEKRVA